MSIIFEAIDADPPIEAVTGFGFATFRLSARGFEILVPEGGGYGRATFDGFRVGVVGNPPPPPPPPYAAASAYLRFVAGGNGNATLVGPGGSASLRFQARGWGVANYGAAKLALEFRAVGSEFEIVEPPPPPEVDAVLVTETMLTSGGLTSDDIAVIAEAFVLGLTQGSRLDGVISVSESIVLGDSVASIYMLMVQEGIVFGDALTEQRAALERVFEALILSGEFSSTLEAIDSMIVGLVFGDLLEGSPVVGVNEALAFADAIQERVTAITAILEGLALGDTLAGSFTATVLVTEGLVFGDTQAISAELHQLISESIGFMATMNIDNGEYLAWVMNADTKGLTRYTNYPFNSFAKIGKRYYGCASDGAHRLDGTNDNGDPINWKLRLGLIDLGTRKLKRVPEVFFMMATDGQCYVHIITTDEAGDKSACIYLMKERSGTNRRENRQKFGRGLKAIDIGYVLEAVDGSTLDLTEMELRPIVLDRRTRG